MSNKKNAIDFLQLVVKRKIDDAYKKYVYMNGKHHNLFFPAGFPALLKAMKENHEQYPDTQIRIKNAIEEGDLVAVHSHVIHTPGTLGVTVVHMFKMKNNKIVEMWDCGMPIPKKSPNKDGPF